MPVRHELSSGKDRPIVDIFSNSAASSVPLLSNSRYGSEEDEDKLYEPDWEITDTDLETYIDMSLRD